MTSRKARRRSAVVALATVGALGLSGCGGAESAAEKLSAEGIEKAMEAGGGGDVDIDLDSESGQMSIEGKDGSMSFGAGGELPDDFPEDLPLPPEDFEVAMSMVGEKHTQATLITTGEVDAIGDLMEQGLVDAGYTIDDHSKTTMGENRAANVTATGKGVQVVVIITGGGEDGRVSLTYAIDPVEEPGR